MACYARAPGRPSCRYGLSCYRRNPQHWLDFDHPNEHEFVQPKAPSTKRKAVEDIIAAANPAEPATVQKKRVVDSSSASSSSYAPDPAAPAAADDMSRFAAAFPDLAKDGSDDDIDERDLVHFIYKARGGAAQDRTLKLADVARQFLPSFLSTGSDKDLEGFVKGILDAPLARVADSCHVTSNGTKLVRLKNSALIKYALSIDVD